MKVYRRYSAAWRRQKETQRNQREAAARPKWIPRTDGQKYLYPERHKEKKNA